MVETLVFSISMPMPESLSTESFEGEDSCLNPDCSGLLAVVWMKKEQIYVECSVCKDGTILQR